MIPVSILNFHGMKRFLILLLVFSATGCASPNGSRDYLIKFREQHMKAREQMVKDQIMARGISDTRVLRAMLTVPRHLFVPEPHAGMAYDDTPLPIGSGQTISQPYIVAFMTEILDLKSSDRVLEIGTGSGYQAAILAEICDSVYTIEIFQELAGRAEATLDSLGYGNIIVKHGDGYLGWPDYAPFDAIIVTCAPESIPPPLKDQLAEGGRMIIPVGDSQVQQLVLLKKKKGKVEAESVLPVIFVPMINATGKTY
jgi:protein-L-isoaspartate(D-aspartate) O-methyltransferase